MSDSIKVKATQLGYYEHKRRREGDVFTLVERKDRFGKIMTAKQQFSSKWMKKVNEDTPESESVMTRVDSGNLELHQTTNVASHSNVQEIMKEPKSKSKKQSGAKESSGDEEVI